MGVNGENPDVTPKSDTQPGATDAEPGKGVAAPKAPEPSANETPVELLGDKTRLEAHESELERQIAILKRDNEQLLESRRKADAQIRRWNAALGLKPGDDPTEALKRIEDERAAGAERIGGLQRALGIGAGDDPAAAALRLKSRGEAEDKGDVGALPMFGRLLLYPAVANLAGLAGYGGCPTSFSQGGDEWFVTTEEVEGSGGEIVPQVVVGVRRRQYAHADAQIRSRQLEEELAAALKGKGTADLQLSKLKGGPRRDPVAERAYAERIEAHERAIREKKADLEKTRPLLEPPEAQTWRFAGRLEDFGAEGGA